MTYKAITFCQQFKKQHMHKMCSFPRNPKLIQGVLHAQNTWVQLHFLFSIPFSLPNIEIFVSFLMYFASSLSRSLDTLQGEDNQ